MLWYKLIPEAVSWSAWCWRHRDQFRDVLAQITDKQLDGAADFGPLAETLFTDPSGCLRRAGNLLLFSQEGAGDTVLAYLEQMSPQLDAIAQSTSELQVGQTALASSLGSLKGLAMVSLGVTAFSTLVLSAQFVAMNRRLAALQGRIAQLEQMFAASMQADLETGLSMLRVGQELWEREDRSGGKARLESALPFCLKASSYYANLIGNELNQKSVDATRLRLQARYLSISIGGIASCQFELGHDEQAFSRSRGHLELLRKAAGWLFQELIVKDLGLYLLPAMQQRGVTLELMSDLYRHAQDAGALNGCMQPSASQWFEAHREAITNAKAPFWGAKKLYDRLEQQIQESRSVIEETNRVLGLSKLAEHALSSRILMKDLMRRLKEKSEPHAGKGAYAAWGFEPMAKEKATARS